jgi:hypothetical protein
MDNINRQEIINKQGLGGLNRDKRGRKRTLTGPRGNLSAGHLKPVEVEPRARNRALKGWGRRNWGPSIGGSVRGGHLRVVSGGGSKGRCWVAPHHWTKTRRGGRCSWGSQSGGSTIVRLRPNWDRGRGRAPLGLHVLLDPCLNRLSETSL